MNFTGEQRKKRDFETDERWFNVVGFDFSDTGGRQKILQNQASDQNTSSTVNRKELFAQKDRGFSRMEETAPVESRHGPASPIQIIPGGRRNLLQNQASDPDATYPASRRKSPFELQYEQRKKLLDSLSVETRPIEVLRGVKQSFWDPKTRQEYGTLRGALAGRSADLLELDSQRKYEKDLASLQRKTGTSPGYFVKKQYETLASDLQAKKKVFDSGFKLTPDGIPMAPLTKIDRQRLDKEMEDISAQMQQLQSGFGPERKPAPSITNAAEGQLDQVVRTGTLQDGRKVLVYLDGTIKDEKGNMIRKGKKEEAYEKILRETIESLKRGESKPPSSVEAFITEHPEYEGRLTEDLNKAQIRDHGEKSSQEGKQGSQNLTVKELGKVLFPGISQEKAARHIASLQLMRNGQIVDIKSFKNFWKDVKGADKWTAEQISKAWQAYSSFSNNAINSVLETKVPFTSGMR